MLIKDLVEKAIDILKEIECAHDVTLNSEQEDLELLICYRMSNDNNLLLCEMKDKSFKLFKDKKEVYSCEDIETLKTFLNSLYEEFND